MLYSYTENKNNNRSNVIYYLNLIAINIDKTILMWNNYQKNPSNFSHAKFVCASHIGVQLSIITGYHLSDYIKQYKSLMKRSDPFTTRPAENNLKDDEIVKEYKKIKDDIIKMLKIELNKRKVFQNIDKIDNQKELDDYLSQVMCIKSRLNDPFFIPMFQYFINLFDNIYWNKDISNDFSQQSNEETGL